ncbi:DNA-binding transcriptional regulator, MocR family, contains an aminotransferase domain [Peptoclostridium litorale DSM 5388]|uniref:Transcriptional regulator, GntR family n=1 Tax=Peptoclostridium litorale DSM 5388 TaxID=1121324 RepID=A0A069REN4_PEPLI|nr:PLP-dependent aminotransferase family protein [Peptoclostridium litorale]KDR95519.1 transcriptional regulator, GntR family [Peptoclostridium litorale DSM 5388]SIO16954.1 DNA-binding transcriptional regulator, MocR family, contains an aminotransferase domain [Peptoclostridium litorale DSM 5388]
MFISIDKHKKEPLYKQVASGITDKILSGELSLNMRLPSVRELSNMLGLSHMTIVKAYELLEKDRMIVKIHGKGVFVNSSVSGQDPGAEMISAWYSSIEDYQPRGLTLNLLKNTLSKKKFNMSYSMLCESQSFKPNDMLSNLISMQPDSLLAYTDTSGDPALKGAFSSYVSKYRGFELPQDNMIVVSGTQQGLSLMASVFTSSKDLVMVESPTYTGAIDAFKSSGALIKPLDVSSPRALINNVLRQCDQRPPKFIYITPNYSNPTGYCLSKTERLELLDIADAFNFHIIEDDPWGEIPFEKETVLPTKAYDSNERVVYLKGMSKVFGAGYRVSFLCASKDIVRAVEKAKAQQDLGTSLLSQRLMAQVIASGRVDAHIKSIGAFIRKRMSITEKIFKESLDKDVTYSIPKGGFNIWLRLPDNISTEEILFSQAGDKGISFLPGAICYPVRPRHNELRISVSYIEDEDFKLAVLTLCQIINKSLK